MTLGFEKFGHGKVPVIALHSWMTTHTSWAALKPWLDGELFTFLLVDHRGYGRSKEQGGPHTAARAAADVLALADASGFERFHLIGHSMSGLVAQYLLADAPERLRSATLLTPVPAGGMPLDPQSLEGFGAAVQVDEAWSGIADQMTGSRLGPRFSASQLPAFRRSVDPTAMTAFLSMWAVANDLPVRMPGRTTPTLLLTGKHDIEPLRLGTLEPLLRPWFADLRVEELETGHFPMLEAPPHLASVLQSFLSEFSS